MKINELCKIAKRTQIEINRKLSLPETVFIEELNIRFNEVTRDYYAHVGFSNDMEGYINEDGFVNVVLPDDFWI